MLAIRGDRCDDRDMLASARRCGNLAEIEKRPETRFSSLTSHLLTRAAAEACDGQSPAGDHTAMDKSNEMSTTAVRRRNKSRRGVMPRQNVLESLATLTPEVRSAVPLVAGSTAAPGSTLAQWVSSRAMR